MKRKIAMIAASKKDNSPIVLSDCTLIEGCLASCAHPFVIRPQNIDGVTLIDGDFVSEYPFIQLKNKYGVDKFLIIQASYARKSKTMGIFDYIMGKKVQSYSANKLGAEIKLIEYDTSDIGYVEFDKVPILVDRVYEILNLNKDDILDFLTT